MTSDQPSEVPNFTPGSNSAGNPARLTTTVAAALSLHTFGQWLADADSSGTTNGPAAQQVQVQFGKEGQPSLSVLTTRYERGVPRIAARSCAAPCAGLTMTRNADNSVSYALSNVTLRLNVFGSTDPTTSTTPVVVNGNLSGGIDGGYLFPSQLPAGFAGSLTVDGVTKAITHTQIDYFQLSLPDPTPYPTVYVHTADGRLALSRLNDSAGLRTTAGWILGNTADYAAVVTAGALLDDAANYTLVLNAQSLPLRSGSGPATVVTANITTGKPGGSVTISGLPTLTAAYSIIGASNTDVIYEFRGFNSSGAVVQPSLSVTFRNGSVLRASGTSANGTMQSCQRTAELFVAACGGTVRLSADGLTLTFDNFVIGKYVEPATTYTVNGTLRAQGR